MARKLDERATCCKAVLVSCSRDWCGHAEAFLVHGNAYPTKLILNMSHTWSARTGPLVLDVKRLPQANPVVGLWRSLRARLKALDVLLAAGDTGSAEARIHEPCSDADTRDRSRVCCLEATKTA